MLKVTFDSNVWESLVDDHKRTSDPEATSLAVILAAIQSKGIAPLLPETIFSLESVMKKKRKDYIGHLKLHTQTTTRSVSGNTTHLEIVLGPEPGAHLGNGPQLNHRLNAALKLGFQLMRLPRFGMPVNPDLEERMYHPQIMSDEFCNMMGTIDRAMAKAGFGMSQLKALGLPGSIDSGTWFSRIRSLADDRGEKKVAKAVAEWADGDAIIMHIAYGNDYFCTRDLGKGAGGNSILAPANRMWLGREYDVKFITTEELAVTIQEIRKNPGKE